VSSPPDTVGGTGDPASQKWGRDFSDTG